MQASLDELEFLGGDLARPECVVCTRAGDVFVSDARGGISHLAPGAAAPRLIAATGPEVPEGFLPNGFALLPDRSFLIANLGPSGGVYHMTPEGALSAFLLEVDGEPLPPTNFVNRDREGGVWVSISTGRVPRELAFRREIADGFIVYVEGGDSGVGATARVVADGIGFTNENKHDATEDWLYVNETIARRVSRYRVLGRGRLGARETVAELGDGLFPDGLDFDVEGGIWIASVVSNRLVRIVPGADPVVILDDSDRDAVAAAEAAYASGAFARAHIDAGRHGVLGNLASVAFGGPALGTLYLGSLFSARIATLPAPVAGVAPPHWTF